VIATSLRPRAQHGGGRRPLPLPRVTDRMCVEAAAKACGCTLGDVQSDFRDWNFILARRVAIYLMRRWRTSSFPEINVAIRGGGVGHSTTVSAWMSLDGVTNRPECRPMVAGIYRLVMARATCELRGRVWAEREKASRSVFG
jgi:hypothetical protein